MNFEVCDIEGPVRSVAKMNDNGFSCVFPMTGDGPAFAARDAVQIPFSRENNVFLIDFYIDDNLEQWNKAENTIAPLVDNEELFNEMMQPFDEEGFDLPGIPLIIEGEGEPVGSAAPVQANSHDLPSVEDIDEHELLGHIVDKAWCPERVLGRGREKQHQRTVRESEVPIVITDYCFMSSTGEKLTVEKEDATKILDAVDTVSGVTVATQCTRKGPKDKYAITYFARWLESLGHQRVILRSDGEPSITSVVRAVKILAAVDVIPETTAVGSHASMGGGEQIHGPLRGSFLAIKSDLERRLQIKIEMKDCIVPWIIRHTPWLRTRYLEQKDKHSSYWHLKGTEYKGTVAKFGQKVMCKLQAEKRKGKFTSQWVTGVWVGKAEVNDTHMILTKNGAINLRTLHRLPFGSQWAPGFFKSCRGVPWDPMKDTDLDDNRIAANVLGDDRPAAMLMSQGQEHPPVVEIEKDDSNSSSSSSGNSEHPEAPSTPPRPAAMEVERNLQGSITPRTRESPQGTPPSSPNKYQKVGEWWMSSGEPSVSKRPLDPPPLMPDMPSLRVEAKRARTDASASSVGLLLQVFGMDIEEDTEIATIDGEQICLKDGDMWEEPEIRVKEGLDLVKWAAERQIEYQRLLDFGVIKVIKKADGEQWIAEKSATYIYIYIYIYIYTYIFPHSGRR
jgi:hypothetical protein